MGFRDGNNLMEWIEGYERFKSGSMVDEDFSDAMRLTGYVQGVVDTLIADSVICPGNSLSVGLARGRSIRYIKFHPEEWHRVGSYLVRAAIEPLYPCLDE